MPDETYEARVARYEAIVKDRAAGLSLAEIGARLHQPIGRERVRQILAAGPPMPVGWSRGAVNDVPTTRVRQRLEARIAEWSQWTDDPMADKLVRKWKQDLAELDEKQEAVG